MGKRPCYSSKKLYVIQKRMVRTTFCKKSQEHSDPTFEMLASDQFLNSTLIASAYNMRSTPIIKLSSWLYPTTLPDPQSLPQPPPSLLNLTKAFAAWNQLPTEVRVIKNTCTDSLHLFHISSFSNSLHKHSLYFVDLGLRLDWPGYWHCGTHHSVFTNVFFKLLIKIVSNQKLK